MRIMKLFLFTIILTAPCTGICIQGRIEDGKYYTPNGRIEFTAQSPENARDIYVSSVDRGFYEEADMFGLRGMYYTSLEGLQISPPSNTDELRQALNAGMTNFAVPNIFAAASRNYEVMDQKFISEEGKEMLLALVRLPGLSGGLNVRTGKKFDAHAAILVLVEKGYIIILRTQSNSMDSRPPAEGYDAALYLDSLRELYAGLQVRE